MAPQTSSQSRGLEQPRLTLEGEIESDPTFDDEFGEDECELTGTALHDMNWFRPKKPGLGLWVFLNSCVIRASDVGSAMSPFAIIPHPGGRFSSLVRDAFSPNLVGNSRSV